MKELEKIKKILRHHHIPDGDKDRVMELLAEIEKERDEQTKFAKQWKEDYFLLLDELENQ